MLADSLIVPECIFRFGSFSGLMTIYESNYIKFARLVGSYPQSDTEWLSTVPGDCDLHLEWLRLLVLGAVLAWFALMGGYIQKLRTRLR